MPLALIIESKPRPSTVSANVPWMSAHARTRPLIVAVIAGNVINLAADYALIFGVPALGIPAMGVIGAALATSLVQLATLVFYALAASVWTVWLWMTGLKRVPASQAGVFTVMLPISAALIGVVFMGERLSGLQLLAFGIALLGLVLATLPERAGR